MWRAWLSTHHNKCDGTCAPTWKKSSSAATVNQSHQSYVAHEEKYTFKKKLCMEAQVLRREKERGGNKEKPRRRSEPPLPAVIKTEGLCCCLLHAVLSWFKPYHIPVSSGVQPIHRYRRAGLLMACQARMDRERKAGGDDASELDRFSTVFDWRSTNPTDPLV